MFFIVATKPLNDGTKGFRFNIFGKKGMVRLRSKNKADRGWFTRGEGSTMSWCDFSRLTVYLNHSTARRKLAHFAG